MTDRSLPVVAASERAALVETRLEQVRDLLAQHAAGGILLDARRDFAWLTVGGQNHILYTTDAGVAPILVTPHDAIVIAPVNEFDRIANEEVAGLPLRVEKVPWFPGAAAELARTTATGTHLMTAVDVTDDLRSLRSRLAPAEDARMEWLSGVILETVAHSLADVRPGMTEDDLIAAAAHDFARHAVRLPVVLVAADERIVRYRHPLSASREIHSRVMLVVVAERWGLHVAHTEFRELEPRSSELGERAVALREVLVAMREATMPGNTLSSVLDAAKTAYARAGMGDEWMLHHQGGTIGYQAREQIATPGDDTVIEAGMAFAWNPSAIGYKLEETLYLDSDGSQHVLTTTP